jgi:hypothetical protein
MMTNFALALRAIVAIASVGALVSAFAVHPTKTNAQKHVTYIDESSDFIKFSTWKPNNIYGPATQFPRSLTRVSLGRGGLDTHPSVRPHISQLNRLYPGGKDPLKSADVESQSELLPVHQDVRSGILPNGLPYIILPNKSPPGRFEAHLQVFSGSSDELEPQQGIAHLTEHVAYMGSRKRERLFGTGSQTNAYTDFHHTVFYAACPVKTPRDGLPMLPMALEALVDVMEARVEPSRLEKGKHY